MWGGIPRRRDGNPVAEVISEKTEQNTQEHTVENNSTVTGEWKT